jgi:hypothetical protein
MTIPSPNLSVDEEERLIVGALGKAITIWQMVEGALSEVFCNLIGARFREAANMAFFSILSFETKLAMTHAAARSAIGATPLWNEWTPIRNRASKRNDRRNQLAHFMLAFDGSKRAGYRFHIRPSAFDRRVAHKWGTKPPEINGCQLTATGNSFDKLAFDLRQLARRCAALPLLPTELYLASRDDPPLEPPTQTEDAPNDTESGDPPESLVP